MSPVAKRDVVRKRTQRILRAASVVGIIVCGAWTIVDLSLGLYQDACAFAFFTAANVFTLLLYRK